MQKGDSLKTGLEIVLALFAAFGSFLLEVLPDIDNKIFIIGLSQFGSLLIFLFIKYLFSNSQTKYFFRISIISAIAFFALGFAYYNFKQKHSLNYTQENEVYVRGTLTDSVINMCKENHIVRNDSCEIFYVSIAQADKVKNMWTLKSVAKQTNFFIAFYFTLVFTLSIALFAAIELIK